ncbi:transposase [Novipirellula artificiosorum]|uniref:Transposase IS200 like protein n=1 Tax=Novipirellula artificiosorum TaxID=2528016 RepID=A0A5C6DY24_9BACT|nr:transposase [Novipirellula artificiosorum]TWU39739.1 Transposase IS200 like protein [Novipirellula artificiosorum]
MPNDTYYERHLPHQVPSGFPIFLTWNLKGSLPHQVIQEIEAEASRLKATPLRRDESEHDRKLRHAKLLFVKRDRSLDNECREYVRLSSLTGVPRVSLERLTYDDRPMWLADSAAACEVAKSILWGVPARYQLWAFVVMGNHVHCLLSPNVELQIVTQGIKGFTSHQINRLQNSTGRTFWQDESFDHWARDEQEMYRIIEYIEQNPVSAKLCRRPELWEWSSASLREPYAWKQGTPFPSDKKDEIRRLFESRVRLR